MEFLKWLSGFRTPFTENLFLYATGIGGELLLIILVCYIYWFLNKRNGQVMLFAYFSSGILAQALKLTFRIPRPWIIDSSHIPVKGALDGATGYSFPSGHTQSVTSVMGAAVLVNKNKKLKTLCILVIILVAFSRMFLGVHTPKDVAVGLIIGICGAAAGYFLIKEKEKFPVIICIIVAAAAAVSFVYAFILEKNGTADLKNTADCCKMAGSAIGFAVSMYLDEKYINYKPVKFSFIKTILLYATGLIILLAVRTFLKFIFPETLVFDAIRYMLLVIIFSAVYPYFLKIIELKNK